MDCTPSTWSNVAARSDIDIGSFICHLSMEKYFLASSIALSNTS